MISVTRESPPKTPLQACRRARYPVIISGFKTRTIIPTTYLYVEKFIRYYVESHRNLRDVSYYGADGIDNVFGNTDCALVEHEGNWSYKRRRFELDGWYCSVVFSEDVVGFSVLPMQSVERALPRPRDAALTETSWWFPVFCDGSCKLPDGYIVIVVFRYEFESVAEITISDIPSFARSYLSREPIARMDSENRKKGKSQKRTRQELKRKNCCAFYGSNIPLAVTSCDVLHYPIAVTSCDVLGGGCFCNSCRTRNGEMPYFAGRAYIIKRASVSGKRQDDMAFLE
ncbi:hypothetical protein RF55_10307 [Lasius niger]|uniref:Uncharacterized protein n=1 Tax=Lasius niger TaxID=67767 RepID=A0A0J7KIE3_LASNI|nr:hypothetical protein RF55_10307 [Lasius niger]